MKKPYIFNIQKFSVNDGPGVRTTIFFKGCPISCAWCHNPESRSYEPQEMENKDGIIEVVGQQYTIAELIKKVEQDQMFYEQSGGGVTLSGGECLSQNPEYILELVKELKNSGISVAIDTCGVVQFDIIEMILEYVDIFLYDLKFIDTDLHLKYTSVGNELVLDNLKKLSNANANINLRLIMLDGINTDEKTINETIKWLKDENIKVSTINLLPYHSFGRDKYKRLKMNYDESVFITPGDDTLNVIKTMFENEGFKTAIGG